MSAPSARVLILCGPSGAGKSRLAERLSRAQGWPIVRLDDFYKDGDDPSLPLSPIGIPDWDDVASGYEALALALARREFPSRRPTGRRMQPTPPAPLRIPEPRPAPVESGDAAVIRLPGAQQ